MGKSLGFVFDKNGSQIMKYIGSEMRVFIPNGVKEIGLLAFFDCEFLEFVYIHKGIEKISSLCFPNIPRLSLFVEHEKKPESWDKKWCHELSNVHWNCRKNKDFIYSIHNEQVTIHKYLGKEREVIIPDFLDGKPVTKIDSFVFRVDCSKIIEFPDGLQEINEYAFFNKYYSNSSYSKTILPLSQSIRYVYVPETTKFDSNAFSELEGAESGLVGCFLTTQMNKTNFRLMIKKDNDFIDFIKGYTKKEIFYFFRAYTNHYFVPVEKYVGYCDIVLIKEKGKIRIFGSTTLYGNESERGFYHSCVDIPLFKSLQDVQKLEIGDNDISLLFCYRPKSEIGVICFAAQKNYRFDSDQPSMLVWSLFGHY